MPSRMQSALDAAGLQASRIEWLWWVMFWITTAVFVAVVAAVFVAVWRARSRDTTGVRESSLLFGVATASGVTLVILIALLFLSSFAGRAVAARPDPSSLTVQITGYQWWWAIEYANPQPSLRVTTANELHLPVGRPVIFNLRAADVIHSFWVPNLHGKTDLIPGRVNTTWLQADSPGVYRGQCAEYCGLQHAHMGLVVVAEPEDQFEKWLGSQRPNAPEPGSPEQSAGRALVEKGACAMCHTVRGTTAAARTAPDLTHVASRRMIGSAFLPNTSENLSRWIRNAQHIKPGTRMPAIGLSDEQLRAVVAYVETLR